MIPQTLTPSAALDIFSDHLVEIRDALASNILHDLNNIRPWMESEDTDVQEILNDLQKLEKEGVVGPRSKTINRIVTRLTPLTEVQKLTQITDEMIESAREVLLEDIFEGQLIRSGRNYTALCPFHQERSKSFHIRVSTNRFKCFGCAAGGDSIDYYMKTHGVPFQVAVRALSTLPSQHHLQ